MTEPSSIQGGERADEIRRLRSSGLTLKAICAELGVAKSIVNRALYPKVRAAEAAYNRERWYTNTCESCGAACTFNRFSKSSRGRLCAPCYRKRPRIEAKP